MTIHEALLRKARAAESRLAEAKRRVHAARTEYDILVRRMHLAGGSRQIYSGSTRQSG